jgi:hypothetical protein
MYGAMRIEELIYAKSIRMEKYPLRKLMKERAEDSLLEKLVDIELERRGILDKLKRRKPEWFI